MTLGVSVGARVWQVALSPVSHREAAVGGAIEWPRSWGNKGQEGKSQNFLFQGQS